MQISVAMWEGDILVGSLKSIRRTECVPCGLYVQTRATRRMSPWRLDDSVGTEPRDNLDVTDTGP